MIRGAGRLYHDNTVVSSLLSVPESRVLWNSTGNSSGGRPEVSSHLIPA